MANYKPIDVTKEDFRKYLERSGFLDAMTKILIKCNADRPDNVIGYVKDQLEDPKADVDQVVKLRAEIQRLEMEISVLSPPASDERSSPDTDLNTTDENESAPPNSAAATANGAEPESPGSEAEDTATAGSVTSAAVTEQGKGNETKAFDAPATEVQNGATMEKPEENEKEKTVKN